MLRMNHKQTAGRAAPDVVFCLFANGMIMIGRGKLSRAVNVSAATIGWACECE
ncbi:MAG: hypothetical protein ACOX0F_10260 [Syntrophomonadaceae bacterium]|jgi:hypothetical protein